MLLGVAIYDIKVVSILIDCNGGDACTWHATVVCADSTRTSDVKCMQIS